MPGVSVGHVYKNETADLNMMYMLSSIDFMDFVVVIFQRIFEGIKLIKGGRTMMSNKNTWTLFDCKLL